MNEVEMCETLGIIAEPDKNKVCDGKQSRDELVIVAKAFLEQEEQRKIYGELDEELWLEFIPWHSLN